MLFAFEETSHISQSYKLFPVQYQEYKYRLFIIAQWQAFLNMTEKNPNV